MIHTAFFNTSKFVDIFCNLVSEQGLGRGENWEREKLAITSVFSPFPQICSLFAVPIIRKNQAGFYELLLCGSFLGPPLLDLHLQPLVSWYLARFICTVHLAKVMRVASLLHLWLARFPVGINHLHLLGGWKPLHPGSSPSFLLKFALLCRQAIVLGIDF